MNENYRDDLAKRLKTVRSIDKDAAEMILKKEGNTEEYKGAKEIHLQERNVEAESSKLETNLNSLENETKEVGGEEVITKTWSLLDEEKKGIILEKIRKFEETRKAGVEMQEFGEIFLDPRDLGFGSWSSGNHEPGIAKVVGPIAYLSGTFPVIGVFFEGVGSIPRAYGSLRKKIEQNTLTRLEKKYQ